MIIPGWQPKKRNIKFSAKPEEIPEYIYNEALAAKRFYNEDWEFWVWQESLNHNVPVYIAEDACIRGLKKALNRIQFVWGEDVAKWYIDFLGMEDIFSKVKSYPTYLPKLGDTVI